MCIVALTVAIACGCNSKPTPSQQEAQKPSPAASPSTPASPAAPDSLAARLSAIQSGLQGKSAAPPLPDWKPIADNAPNPPIPLVKGLVVETAIAESRGDYESLKTITGITPTTVSLSYSSAIPESFGSGAAPAPAAPAAGGPAQEPKLKHVNCTRLIDVADLANAHAYNESFCGSGSTEHYPGTTAISASSGLLAQLQTGQSVDFSYAANNLTGMLSSLVSFAQNGASSDSSHPGQKPGTLSCQLHRVEKVDLAFPVLLNEQPVVLPALHVTCSAENQDEVHIYYLDQKPNPLTLAFQIGSARLQVIRITVPPPEAPPQAASASNNSSAGQGGAGNGPASGGAAQMEEQLKKKEPVEIYGIYFDFNSSVIKPESEPVLKEISDVMHKNPDWKLSVSGHTDSIGDANFNLGLSQRRAAAVKDALVKRYGIAPDRLDTSGFGASRPIADNKTLEGRARNRRVELQRE